MKSFLAALFLSVFSMLGLAHPTGQTAAVADSSTSNPPIVAPVTDTATSSPITAVATTTEPTIIKQTVYVPAAAPTPDLSAYVTQDEMMSQLQSLNNAFRTIIYGSTSTSSTYSVGGLYNMIAMSNKIDSLKNVSISNATINNSTLTNTTGGSTVSDLSSLTGLLGITHGGTGTSTVPGANQLLLSDANGNWEYVSTSSLGLASFGSGTTTLSNGLVINAGCIFINGSCLSAGSYTNYWTSSGSNLYNNTGINIGINTNSPAYPLDVTGFINTGSAYGYLQGGQTVLTASSTSGLTLAGIGAGANLLATTSAIAGNTAFGYQALLNATSSAYNTAFGYQALKGIALTSEPSYNTAFGYGALSSVVSGATNNTAVGYLTLGNNTNGYNNVAVGDTVLASNTSGYNNTAVGKSALYSNSTGNSNIAIGISALYSNSTGVGNVAIGNTTAYNGSASYRTMIGMSAGTYNTGGDNSTVIGAYAMSGSCCYTNTGSTIVGFKAGYNSGNSSDFNAMFGLNSGLSNTTGNDNSFFGAYSGQNITTGANNIAIGWNTLFASPTASNQLNIGNFIFGTGLTSTTSSTSVLPTPSGFLGIGTSSPSSRLTVWGSDAASSTLAFNIVNNASTTVFSVFDGGNAQLSGSLTQSSDRRLKTNINTLDASSSLAAINALTPVTYNWRDPEKGSTRQYGFIAQDVQQVLPDLVSTTSATALTPDGTLGLNYLGLISPIVEAIQSLTSRLVALETTVAGFAASFHTQQLCVGTTCINQTQLANLLALEEQQTQNSASNNAPAVQLSAPVPLTLSTSTSPTLQIENAASTSIATSTTQGTIQNSVATDTASTTTQ